MPTQFNFTATFGPQFDGDACAAQCRPVITFNLVGMRFTKVSMKSPN